MKLSNCSVGDAIEIYVDGYCAQIIGAPSGLQVLTISADVIAFDSQTQTYMLAWKSGEQYPSLGVIINSAYTEHKYPVLNGYLYFTWASGSIEIVKIVGMKYVSSTMPNQNGWTIPIAPQASPNLGGKKNIAFPSMRYDQDFECKQTNDTSDWKAWRDVNKASNECACGIVRAICTYHK